MSLTAEHLALLAEVPAAPEPPKKIQGPRRALALQLREHEPPLLAVTHFDGFGGAFFRRRPAGTLELQTRGLLP